MRMRMWTSGGARRRIDPRDGGAVAADPWARGCIPVPDRVRMDSCANASYDPFPPHILRFNFGNKLLSIHPPVPRSSRGAVRVLVVHPVRLYRDSLAETLLQHRPGLEVRVAADPGCACLPPGWSPDVALVDAASGALDGVVRTAEAFPAARVLTLATRLTPDTVVDWAEAGGAGNVDPDGTVPELLEAIDRALRDEMPCAPSVAAALRRRVREHALRGREAPAHPRLTPREAEIVALIDQGLSNKEIARRLSITVLTVKNHVHNLLEKLGVGRRGAAAARYRELVHSSPFPPSPARNRSTDQPGS
jgi:two-component system nitrate/nitrite response regulator NarL